jgi:hypothetical protein
MGEVWRGFDLRLQRPVAVKVMLGSIAKDPQVLARFVREGLAAARLDHHPVIATVYDAGTHEEQPFLVLELVRGQDLTAVLASSPGGLAIDVVLSYGEQIAEGLAAAHASGIVHRDIKPSNLMLLPGGRIKICDFGIAHLRDASAGLTFTGEAIGTPAYMAPEQWAGREVDERADLYSLGCVLHELLTGQRPVQAGKPPATLPPDLGRLLARLLARHPPQRPATAAAVAAELRVIAGQHRKAIEARDARIGALLAEAERIARSRSPSMKNRILGRIAAIAAERDPGKARHLLAEAERGARALDDVSSREVLEGITVVLARLDPAAAVQVAHCLDTPSQQADALKDAARAVQERDPVTATGMLADAAQVAHTIADPRSRCGQLCQIAEAMADLDLAKGLAILAEAERLSRDMADPWDQALALGYWVAELAASLDPSHARRLLADAERVAPAITDQMQQFHALRLIAEVMASLDLTEAVRVAEAIPDPRERARGLLKVTQVAAERDPGAAWQLVGTVERLARTLDGRWASFRLEELVEIAGRLDLAQAESIAHTISHGQERAGALVKVAKGPGQDPGRAADLLNEARDALDTVWSEYGARVLNDIAEVIAEHDPDRACGLLRAAMKEHQAGSATIGNPVPELTKGMARVANVVARRDVARAEGIARAIDDEHVRNDALCDIAVRIAQWQAAGALRIIRSLGFGADEAMVRIIEVTAGRDPDEAEQLARDTKFDNDLRRADALLAVAGALARPGASGG